MSTTPAQRQASLKARRKAAGLVQVKVWVHPDWRWRIKELALDCQKEATGGILFEGKDLEDKPVMVWLDGELGNPLPFNHGIEWKLTAEDEERAKNIDSHK